jgi:hypothetical protein
MSQEAPSQDYNLRLADLCFRARHGDLEAGKELRRRLIDRKALPFLREVALILVRTITRTLLVSGRNTIFLSRISVPRDR